jgi:hypothetical protein
MSLGLSDVTFSGHAVGHFSLPLNTVFVLNCSLCHVPQWKAWSKCFGALDISDAWFPQLELAVVEIFSRYLLLVVFTKVAAVLIAACMGKHSPLSLPLCGLPGIPATQSLSSLVG